MSVTATEAPTTSVVRRYFAAVDANAVDALLACFTADAVYERPGYEPLRGQAELRHFYEHVRVIASGRHVLEGVVEQPDLAACWGRFEGVDGAGQPLATRFADVYVLRDGLISERRTHFYVPYC